MALDFGLKHSAIFCYNKHNISARKLVAKANSINNKGRGIIVVLSAADADKGCESNLSIFAKTSEEVQTLFHNLNNWLRKSLIAYIMLSNISLPFLHKHVSVSLNQLNGQEI